MVALESVAVVLAMNFPLMVHLVSYLIPVPQIMVVAITHVSQTVALGTAVANQDISLLLMKLHAETSTNAPAMEARETVNTSVPIHLVQGCAAVMLDISLTLMVSHVKVKKHYYYYCTVCGYFLNRKSAIYMTSLILRYSQNFL